MMTINTLSLVYLNKTRIQNRANPEHLLILPPRSRSETKAFSGPNIENHFYGLLRLKEYF